MRRNILDLLFIVFVILPVVSFANAYNVGSQIMLKGEIENNTPFQWTNALEFISGPNVFAHTNLFVNKRTARSSLEK